MLPSSSSQPNPPPAWRDARPNSRSRSPSSASHASCPGSPRSNIRRVCRCCARCRRRTSLLHSAAAGRSMRSGTAGPEPVWSRSVNRHVDAAAAVRLDGGLQDASLTADDESVGEGEGQGAFEAAGLPIGGAHQGAEVLDPAGAVLLHGSGQLTHLVEDLAIAPALGGRLGGWHGHGCLLVSLGPVTPAG